VSAHAVIREAGTFPDNLSRFFLLMAAIYLFWWLWERPLHFFPITRWINGWSAWMVEGLYYDSVWILTRIFGLPAVYDGQRICLGPPGSLNISYPCSGIRQFTQFTLLMIFYPGPWLKKAWFIPLGLLAVHLTNLLRITGLSLVIVYLPGLWHFFHGYITKGMFYLVFFSLWVIWAEYITRERSFPERANL
jgi:exosortase/archaeosortase family protein